MKHIHLAQCHSTQSYLIDFLKNSNESELLVTTSDQTDGRGRRGNLWLSNDNSLAMSFLMESNEKPTLSTIEVGLILRDFFKDKFNLTIDLKWPNDLFYLGKKVGGVVMKINGSQIICGLGINLKKVNDDYGYLFDEEVDPIGISKDIYQFILKNRIKSEKVIERFNNECFHVEALVEIIDGESSVIGVFERINENGAAVIIDNEYSYEAYTGSLFIR